MNKIVNLLLWTTIGLYCMSCTEEIELDLNNGDNLKLVVDAWLDNSGREQSIKLSLSSDYFDPQAPKNAEGAVVTVTSDRKEYSFTESKPGVYINETFDGQPEETYNLNIEYNGQSYKATQTMQRVSELQQINYVLYDTWEEGDDFNVNNPDSLDEYDVYVTFQDPLGEGDHYYFDSFLKSEGPESSFYVGAYYNDLLLDGALIDDEYVTYGYYTPGDTIVTQMFSITKEVHDYFLAIDEQTSFRGFVFDKPPANVPTNISNDGKGYFIVSAVSELEKVLE